MISGLIPAERLGTPELVERIRAEILDRGPISFARFMEMAQHDPLRGYYAAGPERLGAHGDFVTASDSGPAFGSCLARQIADMDALLDGPAVFAVTEFGGGRGLLARDILDATAKAHPHLATRLRYRIVESSRGMREEVVRRAPEAEVVGPGEAPYAGTGCAIAIELFDALPVHRLRRRRDRLVEVEVALDRQGRFVETEGEPRPEALACASRWGAAPEDGDEAEVCPLAESQLQSVAASVARGFVLLVDYGHRAADLYGPRHARGTLLAYSRHAASEEYLVRVGRQDLTAHVNFSQLEECASELGLEVLGLTTQDRFLLANGILEQFQDEDEARWARPDRVRDRLLAMPLIHPGAMGRRFRVLVLAKGLERSPRIRGLADPFA